MNNLKLVFYDNSTDTINSKILLIKLIINCETNFEPYAKHWLSPIMQFVLDKHLGNNLNYFIIDVVIHDSINNCIYTINTFNQSVNNLIFYRYQCLFHGIIVQFLPQKMRNS